MKSKKKEQPAPANDPNAIDVFKYMRPEIFAFFKSLFGKRKSELNAKLDNRQTKEEKEVLITEERKRITGELENHPLFVIYPLMTKPFTESESLYKGLISGLPAVFNVANTESELKAKEAVL